MSDPFESPHEQARSPASDGPFGLWIAYLAYCGLMALMYGAVAVIGILTAYAGMLDGFPEEDQTAFVALGAVYVAAGVLFGASYLPPFVLGRSRAGYYYGFYTIGMGLLSGCTVLFSVPLLLLWLGKHQAWLRGE